MLGNVEEMNRGDQVLAVRDEDTERPIPTAWRQPLREIVNAFVMGEFGLEKGVKSVSPVSVDTAFYILSNIKDYGATLVALPEATWSSSTCIWCGCYWDALVDLWTQEEGRSDLVLHVRVAEADMEFEIEVYLVYVP